MNQKKKITSKRCKISPELPVRMPHFTSIITHRTLAGAPNDRTYWHPKMKKYLKYFLPDPKYWEKIDMVEMEDEKIKLKPTISTTNLLPPKEFNNIVTEPTEQFWMASTLYTQWLSQTEKAPARNKTDIIKSVTGYGTKDIIETIDKTYSEKLKIKQPKIHAYPWAGETVENSFLMGKSDIDLDYIKEYLKRPKRGFYENLSKENLKKKFKYETNVNNQLNKNKQVELTDFRTIKTIHEKRKNTGNRTDGKYFHKNIGQLERTLTPDIVQIIKGNYDEKVMEHLQYMKRKMRKKKTRRQTGKTGNDNAADWKRKVRSDENRKFNVGRFSKLKGNRRKRDALKFTANYIGKETLLSDRKLNPDYLNYLAGLSIDKREQFFNELSMDRQLVPVYNVATDQDDDFLDDDIVDNDLSHEFLADDDLADNDGVSDSEFIDNDDNVVVDQKNADDYADNNVDMDVSEKRRKENTSAEFQSETLRSKSKIKQPSDDDVFGDDWLNMKIGTTDQKLVRYILRPLSSRTSLPYFIYEMFEVGLETDILTEIQKEEARLKKAEEEELSISEADKSVECGFEHFGPDRIIRYKTELLLRKLFTKYRDDPFDDLVEKRRFIKDVGIIYTDNHFTPWKVIQRRIDQNVRVESDILFPRLQKTESTISKELCFIQDLKRHLGPGLIDSIVKVLHIRPDLKKPIEWLTNYLNNYISGQKLEKEMNKRDELLMKMNDYLFTTKLYAPRRFHVWNIPEQSETRSTFEKTMSTTLPSDWDPYKFVQPCKEYDSATLLNFLLNNRLSSESFIETPSHISFNISSFLSVTSRMTIGSSLYSMSFEDPSNFEIESISDPFSEKSYYEMLKRYSMYPTGYGMDPDNPEPFNFDGANIISNDFIFPLVPIQFGGGEDSFDDGFLDVYPSEQYSFTNYEEDEFDEMIMEIVEELEAEGEEEQEQEFVEYRDAMDDVSYDVVTDIDEPDAQKPDEFEDLVDDTVPSIEVDPGDLD